MEENARFKLYHYWRSSSSWRVRWALAHKGIEPDYVAINLLGDDAESPAHRERSPMAVVPALELPGSSGTPIYLTESLAIIEWLEEMQPRPALLPRDPLLRARVRQLAEFINAGIQPLQNLGPQFMYSDDPEKRKIWCRHWITQGLDAYEAVARTTAGRFSVGDNVTIADLCLVPQCYSARRYDLDIAQWPTIARVEAECLKLEPCKTTAPEQFQPKS
jgi:maleylacetoacetate isomerase